MNENEDNSGVRNGLTTGKSDDVPDVCALEQAAAGWSRRRRAFSAQRRGVAIFGAAPPPVGVPREPGQASALVGTFPKSCNTALAHTDRVYALATSRMASYWCLGVETRRSSSGRCSTECCARLSPTRAWFRERLRAYRSLGVNCVYQDGGLDLQADALVVSGANTAPSSSRVQGQPFIQYSLFNIRSQRRRYGQAAA